MSAVDSDLIFALHNSRATLDNHLQWLLATAEEQLNISADQKETHIAEATKSQGGTHSSGVDENSEVDGGDDGLSFQERLQRLEEDNVSLSHAVFLLEATLAGAVDQSAADIDDSDLQEMRLDDVLDLLMKIEDEEDPTTLASAQDEAAENDTAPGSGTSTSSPVASTVGATDGHDIPRTTFKDASTQLSRPSAFRAPYTTSTAAAPNNDSTTLSVPELPIYHSLKLGPCTEELLTAVEADKTMHELIRSTLSVCEDEDVNSSEASGASGKDRPRFSSVKDLLLHKADHYEVVSVPIDPNYPTFEFLLSPTTFTPKRGRGPLQVQNFSHGVQNGDIDAQCRAHPRDHHDVTIRFCFENVDNVTLGAQMLPDGKGRLLVKQPTPALGSCPPIPSDIFVAPSQFSPRQLCFSLHDLPKFTFGVPQEADFLRLLSQIACINGHGQALKGPSHLFSHFRPRRLRYKRDGSAIVGNARVFMPKLARPHSFTVSYKNACETINALRFPIVSKMATEDVEFCCANHVNPEVFVHIKQHLLQDPLREWFGFLDIVSSIPTLNGLNVWEAKMILAHFLDQRWCVGEEMIFVEPSAQPI